MPEKNIITESSTFHTSGTREGAIFLHLEYFTHIKISGCAGDVIVAQSKKLLRQV